MDTEGSAVAVGIDAAVVADHHVVVRRPVAGEPGEVLEAFSVSPTLAGMERLAKRLAPYPASVAVAEPTSMTWLPLALAMRQAGGSLALVGNRHAARLRGALAGKNKSDVIDAEMLSRAGEFFTLEPARIPSGAELALRRAHHASSRSRSSPLWSWGMRAAFRPGRETSHTSAASPAVLSHLRHDKEWPVLPRHDVVGTH